MSEPLAPITATSEAGSTPRRRRVLIIAYSFPPVGGAGVQRPAKWTKYLPAAGWDVTVLTPSNPSVPVRDESLLRDIPAQTQIVQAPTFEPGYALKRSLGGAASANGTAATAAPTRIGLVARLKQFAKSIATALLQPDSQVLWYPGAIRAAKKLLREQPHEAIIVTAPPYSSFLLGCRLKRIFGLPLVLDFRDEWDLSQRYLEHGSRGWWGQWVQTRLQRLVLNRADAIIATTQASLASVVDRHPEPARLLAECIYNGFDPDDFVSGKPVTSIAAPSDRLRIVYTGTLWNLTDIGPVVQALVQLQQRSPELAGCFELVCVGRKTPEQLAVLEPLRQTACQFRDVDYCPHDDVIAWQRSADLLLLLLAAGPGAERVVPAKLFEYMAAERPMLAITPNGECADLARSVGATTIDPLQTEALTNWLAETAEAFRTAGLRPALQSFGVLREFSRPAQAEQLARLLDRVTGHQPVPAETPSPATTANASPTALPVAALTR